MPVAAVHLTDPASRESSAALAALPPTLLSPAAMALHGALSSSEPSAASKRQAKPPQLALYHSLDARRVIKRRLRRRRAHQRAALEQQAQLLAMEVQLAALEAQQQVLVCRVARERAACRQLVALVASVQSTLPAQAGGGGGAAVSGQPAAPPAAQPRLHHLLPPQLLPLQPLPHESL